MAATKNLEKYWKKRNFAKTPEPKGGDTAAEVAPEASTAADAANGLPYVIQKHAARRLHYDFRLELDGTLKSWAIPRGPSLNPDHKRLAVHVEDHPLEYQDFEGVIPKGEYGGGSVIVWDQGTWFPEEDPHIGYAKGHLAFRLEGDKLHGVFHLVRLKPRRNERDENAWLLMKSDDKFASNLTDITEERPESAVTGRTVEEVAADPSRTWHSNRARTKPPARREFKVDIGKEAKMPTAIEPQLASSMEAPPVGKDWIYEIKLDGYRAIAFVENGKVRIKSRNGNDWSQPMHTVARACVELPIDNAILDGEVVVFTDRGTTSFQMLQNALGDDRKQQLRFCVFDLLYLQGRDLRDEPLMARKTLLKKLLALLGPNHTIRYSEHIDGAGEVILAQVAKLGGEGIVAKRRNGKYIAKRSKDWAKIKCMRRQEVVIGGYTEPDGSRTGIGALLIGVHDSAGRLRYSGKVGTGFSVKTLAELEKKLALLERPKTPFATGGPVNKRGVHYVEPTLVAEVAFAEWTEEGALRHPSFQGLRIDKDPAEVVRETTEAADDEEIEEKLPVAPAPKKAGKNSDVIIADVKLTNPNRVLYAEEGIKKQEVAEYYLRIGEVMLPHVQERPLMMYRCPEGTTKACFYQKHATPGLHESVHQIDVADDDGKESLYLESVSGLVALAQISALEIHTWGSRIDDVERPDLLVMDLDPAPDVPWSKVVEGAQVIRAVFKDIGLKSFVKTTGGKGLHVIIPLVRALDWNGARAFTSAIAHEVARRAPKDYIAVMTKAKRTGKIFIDYLRNARGATFIAPYSTRARPGAPVAMPVEWEELEALAAGDAFTLKNAATHIEQRKRDPWEGIFKTKHKLKADALQALLLAQNKS